MTIPTTRPSGEHASQDDPPIHEPVGVAPFKVRLGLLVGCASLLFGLVLTPIWMLTHTLEVEFFYALCVSIFIWVVLATILSKLFFRTVNLFRVVHTQDVLHGRLRTYTPGTYLTLPWEETTEDGAVDTEAKLIIVPSTRVPTADGSPMLVNGQIRYRVLPKLSHRFIGVNKAGEETSILATVLRITREQVAKCVDPEDALAQLLPSGTRLGLIAGIEELCMNGAHTTRLEADHGVRIEGVPLFLQIAPETEKILLDRFEDRRLGESGKAIVGYEEQVKLALLNNPNSKYIHTKTEEKNSNDLNVHVTGAKDGDNVLGQLIALGRSVADAITSVKGNPNKGKESKDQKSGTDNDKSKKGTQ